MYATLSDLKAYLAITSSTDDTLLTALLTRASAAIDAYCERWFSVREETRYYDNTNADGAILYLDTDLLTVDEIISDSVEVEAQNCLLLPRNYARHYAILRKGGSAWGESIEVTGTWGFSATPPADIVHACIRLAAYYYRQRDAQVFDVTAMPEQGVITVPRGIPADVRVILDRYKRL